MPRTRKTHLTGDSHNMKTRLLLSFLLIVLIIIVFFNYHNAFEQNTPSVEPVSLNIVKNNRNTVLPAKNIPAELESNKNRFTVDQNSELELYRQFSNFKGKNIEYYVKKWKQENVQPQTLLTEEEMKQAILESQAMVDELQRFAENQDWDLFIEHVNVVASGNPDLVFKAIMTASMLDAPIHVIEQIDITHGINENDFVAVLALNDNNLELLKLYDKKLGLVANTNNDFQPFDPVHMSITTLSSPYTFEYLLRTYNDITAVNPVSGTNILGAIIIESTFTSGSLAEAKQYIDLYLRQGHVVDEEALRVLDMIKESHPVVHQSLSKQLGLDGDI